VAREKRRHGDHGAYPLSPATRRRLLASMLEKAEQGDVLAATSLILIGLRLEQAEAFAGQQKTETAAA
jgi:hypothetical protein